MKTLSKLITYLRFDPVTVLQKVGITSDSSKAASFFLRLRVDRLFRDSGLEGLFKQCGDLKQNKQYQLFLSGHKKADIVNIYEAAKLARVVVEFGCGVSTLAIAHALKQKGSGVVYAVEADVKWASLVREAAARLSLSEHCVVFDSTPVLTLRDFQVVSFFSKLPDVRPDLIYLDGPSSAQVNGNSHGLTMSGLEFIVAADPLLYEWSFYAGAKIIVDGRINNVRFLERNLRRKYRVSRNYLMNTTTFSLVR